MSPGDVVLGAALGFCLGCLVCGLAVLTNFERHYEIVAHQAAHYDPQTGAFTWNMPEKK